jgi:uncharacterized protein (TIGR01777 family)
MNITISGGTGFIGRKVVETLLAQGHSLHLLGRKGGAWPDVAFSTWDAGGGAEPPAESLAKADTIVHLAGEPVAQRWTEDAKRKIRASRVDGTRKLVEAVAKLPRRPAALVCASAVGYYGSRGDEILTESSSSGQGFLPEVCTAWEEAARGAEALGLRVASLRIGVVLGREGGALARMLPPFRMGMGGPLASGRQWMSWIHLEDLAALIGFAIAEPGLHGPVNAVSPNPARNTEFTRELAAALRRPAFFRVPAFALKLIFGEMSQVMLDSQRAVPRAAEAGGFRFRHPELGQALRAVLAV